MVEIAVFQDRLIGGIIEIDAQGIVTVHGREKLDGIGLRAYGPEQSSLPDSEIIGREKKYVNTRFDLQRVSG